MPDNVSTPSNTPEPAEPELPDVIAHSDDEEDYPCSAFACNLGME